MTLILQLSAWFEASLSAMTAIAISGLVTHVDGYIRVCSTLVLPNPCMRTGEALRIDQGMVDGFRYSNLF